MGARKPGRSRKSAASNAAPRRAGSRQRSTAVGLQLPTALDLSSVARYPGPDYIAPSVRSGPDPLFECNQFIPTPQRVCENQLALIVGYEWGPNHNRKIGPGWVYLLVEVPKGGFPIVDGHRWTGGRRFHATEEEMARWKREANR